MIGHVQSPKEKVLDKATSHIHTFVKRKQTTGAGLGKKTSTSGNSDADAQDEHHLGDLDFEELKQEYLAHHSGAAYRHRIVFIKGFHIPILEVVCFIWEFIIFLDIILSCLLVIYHVAFTFGDEEMENNLLILNVAYGIDVLIRVGIEIWRAHTNSIYVFFKVQYSFTQLVLDLIVLLPLVQIAYFLIILINPDSMYWLSAVKGFYLLRLLSIYRLEQYLTRIVQDSTFNEKIVILFKLLFFYIICCEIFAAWLFSQCGVSYLQWIVLNGPATVDHRNKSCYLTFRRRRALFQEQIRLHELPTSPHLFFLTMDFVITIFTTTGKNSTIPFTNVELVICILIIIASIFMNGVLASKMLDFRIENDAASYDLFYRLDCAEKLYSSTVPEYFLKRLKEYYLFFWNFRQGVKDRELEALPGPMHESIMINICQELFDKSLLFHDIESSFLTALSLRTELHMYNPGMVLCNQGQRCGKMFFLLQGELTVRSKTNIQHAAAILRAGCIIGEVNLMFSIPYETQIETRVVCQALVIDRDSLFHLLELFPHVLQVLREKFGRLTERLSRDYDFIGTYPLQYAVRRANRISDKPRFTMRRKFFIHQRTADVVDDTTNTYIMSMPSFEGEPTRDYSLPYRSCPVPIAFIFGLQHWASIYNTILVLIVLLLEFILPVCAAYHQDLSTIEFDASICQPLADYWFLDYVLPIGLIFMVIIEIEIASPSSGFWYGLRDGLHIRIHSFQFYLDLGCVVATVLPLNLYEIYDVSFRNPFLVPGIVVIVQFVKVWRYFTLLDNLYPLNLLLVRFFKTFVSLIYFIHFTTCMLYWISVNNQINWFDSIAIGFESRQYLGPVLKLEGPYLYPFYFATALITSGGFSEFSGTTYSEIIIVSCLEVLGFFLLALLVTELASGISCSVIPVLRFQQRLQGINDCLKHFNVKEKLTSRVQEHYTLQFEFTKGVKLASDEHILLHDAPYYLSQAVVDAEYRSYLQGIPLFSNAEDDVFQRVVNHMSSYILPPGIIFQRKGEVRHEMYIIVNGHVGMFEPLNGEHPSETGVSRKRTSSYKYFKEQKYISLLGPTAHFGIRDLLFSEPPEHEIRTLSYVHLYIIDQRCLKESISREEAAALHKIIEEEKGNIKRCTVEVAMERRNVIVGGDEDSKEVVVEQPSWMYFPLKQTENYPHCTYDENQEIWSTVLLGSFLRHFLMSKTVHPAGAFAKGWTVAASFGTLVTILTLFIEEKRYFNFQLFMGYRSPRMRVVNLFLDIISWIDVYLKLNWCFYAKNKSLISHPTRTASRYFFEGMFIYDCCFSIPVELLSSLIEFFVYGFNNFLGVLLGYGRHATWYSKLRWVRFLQIYRFFALFQIVRGSTKHRTFNFITFYLILCLAVSLIYATIAIYIGCPWGYHDWTAGDEYRMPLCFNGWIASISQFDFIPLFKRLVIGTYYSIQILFCVGFGDLTLLSSHTELIFILIIALSGIMLVVYVASDITAAEVDSDELRGQFIERKSRVLYLLARAEENRGQRWIKPVTDHLNYAWLMTRGLQPKQLFGDLHPSLSNDLFKHFVGDCLDGIPLFQDLSEPAMRYMCNLFEKVNFLKGHHIARIGNLQFEFCIIIRGSAYVCNSSTRWLCTLRAGEFFGETDLLFELPRKHAIVAATNIELLVLNLRDFNKLLKYYPKVREKMLEMLKESLNDVHECKIRPEDEDDESYKQMVTETTGILRTLVCRNPRSLEGIAKRLKKEKKTHHSPLHGWGIADSDLPFLYFATDHPKKFKFLIHPKCTLLSMFEKVCLLASFTYPCSALYWVIFILLGPKPIIGTDLTVQVAVMVICVLSQIILVLDMILHWITPYELPEPEVYCKVFKKIMINYVTDVNLLLLDIVTVPPWYLLHPALIILLFCRLIYFYGHLQKQQKENMDISILASRLYFYGSFFLLFGHVVACLFFHLAFIHPRSIIQKTWIDQYNDTYIEPGDEESLFTGCWYLRALYFSFVTITTTGLGDIVPLILNTYILTIVAMFIGAFGVSLIIANITVGLTSLSKAHRVYFYNVLLMTNHLTNIGLSKILQAYVRAYYLTLWQECRGVPTHESLRFLPKSMRLDVASVLFSATLTKCQMFSTFGELTFIRNVCAIFKHSIFLPGQFIAREGEAGNKLFIVHRGEVASYERNDKGGTDFLKKYTRGDAFGKTAVFYHRSLYLKSYRAETLTQILVLSQAKLLLIAKYFPRWQFYVENFIHARHQHVLHDPEARHLFQEPDRGNEDGDAL